MPLLQFSKVAIFHWYTVQITQIRRSRVRLYILYKYLTRKDWLYIGGLVQERRNFFANTLELLRLSCTNPLMLVATKALLPIVASPVGDCLYINGLVQGRRNSVANALELHLSCINPSILQQSPVLYCSKPFRRESSCSNTITSFNTNWPSTSEKRSLTTLDRMWTKMSQTRNSGIWSIWVRLGMIVMYLLNGPWNKMYII